MHSLCLHGNWLPLSLLLPRLNCGSFRALSLGGVWCLWLSLVHSSGLMQAPDDRVIDNFKHLRKPHTRQNRESGPASSQTWHRQFNQTLCQSTDILLCCNSTLCCNKQSCEACNHSDYSTCCSCRGLCSNRRQRTESSSARSAE